MMKKLLVILIILVLYSVPRMSLALTDAEVIKMLSMGRESDKQHLADIIENLENEQSPYEVDYDKPIAFINGKFKEIESSNYKRFVDKATIEQYRVFLESEKNKIEDLKEELAIPGY